MKSFRAFGMCLFALALLLQPALAQQASRALFTSAPPGEPQHILLPQGELRGVVADGVAWYLNIPFTRPPVGDLRWKPPAPPPSWSGERDATQAGPPCDQAEDCLTLNVLRPAEAKPGGKLPVMVWIHGGAGYTGSALGREARPTAGVEFAKKGIVAVSIQYRLGRMGLFAHPALTREGGPLGNFSTMDQIAALQWVHDNIGEFGGDPDNVTIYGVSAGGVSVTYLALSSQAKGLFQKGVVESGITRSSPLSLKAAEEAGVRIVRAAGAPADADAATLRRIPFSSLSVEGGMANPDRPYYVLDGQYIISSAAEGFAAGRARDISLIIGSQSNDASIFRPTESMLDGLPPDRLAKVMEVFDPNETGDRLHIANDLFTATFILEPARYVARTQAQLQAPIWVYYFDYVTPADRDRKPYGAFHGDEYPFVFGLARSTDMAAEDIPLSDAINAYWAAFAKSGDPDAGGGPAWPQFTLDGEHYMEFGMQGPTVKDHLLQERLDLAESFLEK